MSLRDEKVESLEIQWMNPEISGNVLQHILYSLHKKAIKKLICLFICWNGSHSVGKTREEEKIKRLQKQKTLSEKGSS